MSDPAVLELPIETTRLIIRRPERKDMRGWSALHRSPVVRTHMRGTLHRSASDWWKRLLQAPDDSTKPLTVEFTATGQFMGVCGFLEADVTNEWEIYCMLRRKHWHHGFATEVTRALLDAAFSGLGATRVIGIIDPGNVRSIRMVERMGFARVGPFSKPGSWQDGHLLFIFDRSTYNSLLNTDVREQVARAG